MTKRPETIATEMSGAYAKNESMSFLYCIGHDISFLCAICNWNR